MTSKAHIANHFLQASIRGAERQGYSSAELLRAADIPQEYLHNPQRLLTEQQYTQLIKTVWRSTSDEFMGMGPEPCRNGVFALMTEFCLSAATLGAVLSRSARFYSVVYPAINIALDNPDTGSRLYFYRLQMAHTDQDEDHLLQEFLLLMWQRLACWLVDQQVPIAATHFNYAEPAHADEYHVMYPGELVFDQDCSGFYLHERYLQMPIVRTETELQEFLRESPAYILHRPSQDDSLTAKVRATLGQYDYNAMPQLEILAKSLHAAPRTIARKLKDEGSSYSTIKASLRREYAIKLLTTEHLTVAEVGERLGFTETASFCRAFKRWTGKVPSGWRGK
ncbi:AraC family transcriptional regulator [Oceanicoccus sp. KOV_DT_Chl]|uniref:AraC family transcriptional regulator n=1 Tax=Oceanicoccus sp. KOV_DT_Chl TaxID=1904639 RepID=UPI000C79B569|nr:AraC family transcriptional regulator [Oceanicoccus sp. KOV_DT_Chl]